jgi:hypothetical protein
MKKKKIPTKALSIVCAFVLAVALLPATAAWGSDASTGVLQGDVLSSETAQDEQPTQPDPASSELPSEEAQSQEELNSAVEGKDTPTSEAQAAPTPGANAQNPGGGGVSSRQGSKKP